MAEKALVTGATGFLGSHIAGTLVRAGHSVRVLRRASSNTLALEEQLADAPHETVIGNILDEAAMREACDGIDWLFHAAAVADYLFADEELLLKVNIEGTRRVLAAAAAAGVRRVIFTSSASAIGPGLKGQAVDESEPFRLDKKRFPYAWSKVQAERICAEFHEKGLAVVILNPTIITGPGDLNMIAGNLLRLVMKLGAFAPVTAGGSSLIDVRDAARLHLVAAERGQPGERYLLGKENLSAAQAFALIAEIYGVPRPRLFIPTPLLNALVSLIEITQKFGLLSGINAKNLHQFGKRFYYDSRKADAALGPATIDIRQSLRDGFDWYQRNGYTAEW